MAFLLMGIIMNGLYFVTEEKLFILYKIDPLTMIIWEGIFGFIISLVVLFILQIFVCQKNFQNEFCEGIFWLNMDKYYQLIIDNSNL